MNKPKQNPTQDNTREQILTAANTRFLQYGYGKTTMAEIAGDAGMSAANLYRYFENKQDIGVNLALRCFATIEAILQEIINQPNLSASQRLEYFILAQVRFIYDQHKDQPRINELVEDIVSNRPDIVEQKNQGEQALLAEILVDGNNSGEFNISDISTTAETVKNTILLFSTPLFIQAYSLEKFEAMAHNTACLLIRGLANK